MSEKHSLFGRPGAAFGLCGGGARGPEKGDAVRIGYPCWTWYTEAMKRIYKFTRYKRVSWSQWGERAYEPVEVVELEVTRDQDESWGEAIDRAKRKAFS